MYVFLYRSAFIIYSNCCPCGSLSQDTGLTEWEIVGYCTTSLILEVSYLCKVSLTAFSLQTINYSNSNSESCSCSQMLTMITTTVLEM